MGNEKKKAIAEMSVDTQVLIKRLSTVATGETVPYSELSQLIGRNVQNGARHLLQSACRRLEHDDKIVFAPVFGVGVKRLDDAGVVQAGQHGIQKIRNGARRVTRRLLECVTDYEKLPKDEQRNYNVAVATAGILSHITKPSTVKKIEGRVAAMSDTVPAKFLDAVRETL